MLHLSLLTHFLRAQWYVFVRLVCSRLDTLVDDFGMVPNDYDGPATVVTEFSIQHPEMLSDSNDRIRNKVTDPYASVVQDDGNGGWGQQLHQVNKSGRCDLHEYQVLHEGNALVPSSRTITIFNIRRFV